ncbi:histidine phosphatase family protein [Terasakiella sp. A23]|uniref:histidine phosphatase family protein n=1 Tax=Terasakiella sp. FCG-A23 TaxID=3080561 RepID=UPI002955B9ED|nr:histidine phosphatase family protein [Terasakiella sp. A23]MDV7338233.1 histidine phosphatase family protein [Terasakiella sp. A23]
MVKELLIMRHGHAKNQSAYGDFGRELKDKGKRNAQRMGVWLAQNDLRPDHVIASPAVRAKRTAEKCCKTSGLHVSVIDFDERLFNALPQTVLNIIKKAPKDAERLMIVGHNPSLATIVSMLSGGYHAMEPASLAHFKVDGKWADLDADCCTMEELVYATNLPELFPFPDLDSTELRVRPAYYYTQSCVVPYRVQDGQLEVMIISSSKNKHWVVPKGIHDPGLSAQASAANEAFEEAGVLGDVKDGIMGTYSYPKWDATCEVSVFAMKVTRELDDTQWEESHRMRRWVNAQSAAQLVNNPDLATIVATLPDFLSDKTS